MTLTIILQEQAASINLWEMAMYGGYIMLILAIMFAGGIYIFIERLVTLKAAQKDDKTFMNRIKDYIHEGRIDAAIKLCKDENTPAARLVEKGISRLGRPLNDVMVAIENVGNLEIAKLEKGLAILASISGGAPMLGFLGTVTGMVMVFFTMSQHTDGSVQLIDLSSGLYQAMVTTVGGLIVGILAYFAYNYLVARVATVVHNLESKTMEFMDILNEPSK
jgi:biopolymer transport protein ExbB